MTGGHDDARSVREPFVPYDPGTHHRRSIRLKGYDYALVGAYFITICTQGRVPLFGDIQDGELVLNAAGQMVEAVWDELPTLYESAVLDTHVVMPNHLHGIVLLTASAAPTIAMPDVMHRLKSLATTRYRHGVIQQHWPAFSGRLWQRNYYEHILRDEKDLNRVRDDIINNPARWNEDEYRG